MSVVSELFKGGVEGVTKGIGSMAKDIRAAITGKETLTGEDLIRLQEIAQLMEVKALEADLALAQGQIEINKIEAGSDSFFKSGWRPAVGWVCVLGLSYEFLFRPIAPWAFDACGFLVKELPSLDTMALTTLLGGLLGLSGFRTFEKVRGVSKK